MKGDAKLSRETPGVSDSCTTRRGSSGRCIWNAAAGILDGFRDTGGTGGPPPGQFFLGPRRILLRAPRTKLPVKSRCRRPLMCRWQWVPRWARDWCLRRAASRSSAPAVAESQEHACQPKYSIVHRLQCLARCFTRALVVINHKSSHEVLSWSNKLSS